MKNGKKETPPKTPARKKPAAGWKRLFALVKLDGAPIVKLEWDRTLGLGAEEKAPRVRQRSKAEQARLYAMLAQIGASMAQTFEAQAVEMMRPKGDDAAQAAQAAAAAAAQAAGAPAAGKKAKKATKKSRAGRAAAPPPPAP
jgi:hypothetical protein